MRNERKVLQNVFIKISGGVILVSDRTGPDHLFLLFFVTVNISCSAVSFFMVGSVGESGGRRDLRVYPSPTRCVILDTEPSR